MADVRLRFAPSPTGPLHIGGIRTALYNYLYAKQKGGKFILRLEDTDQKRYVEGAPQYIKDALEWSGIHFDEGPGIGGDYGPYIQSERSDLYKKYTQELLDRGHAYYAFDTGAELDQMRKNEEATGNQGAKYNYLTRSKMKNSLSLSTEETQAYLDKGESVTVRLLIPRDENILIEDGVRGQVTFHSDQLDDKVIMKADGLPTYHLANIVDDHHMKISHVIRGEEWLSSTAHHLLMYRFLEWEAPNYAHLPLILKPTGKGKLSKRDGAKFGFPVFPLSWIGDSEEESFIGFKEAGFLPEALVNFMALLGWSPGNDEEVFSMEALQSLFSIKKIVKSGARFDFDKLKWFNQQYIIKMNNDKLADLIKPSLGEVGLTADDGFLSAFAGLMKERVEKVGDFIPEGRFFFTRPDSYDSKMVKKKYREENNLAFQSIISIIRSKPADLQTDVKSFITDNEYKFGQILPILRISITGSMKGPDLFETIALIGHDECAERIELFLEAAPEILVEN